MEINAFPVKMSASVRRNAFSLRKKMVSMRACSLAVPQSDGDSLIILMHSWRFAATPAMTATATERDDGSNVLRRPATAHYHRESAQIYVERSRRHRICNDHDDDDDD